jgi:hypothetical protein
MLSSSLPVIVHLDCPRTVAFTGSGRVNEFQIVQSDGAPSMFSVDRVISAKEAAAGNALAKAMMAIPRYASLLLVLLGDSVDSTVADMCAHLEKIVAEPSSLSAQFLANDGTGTLSETLLYEDCVALSKERERGDTDGAVDSVSSRFRGVQMVNVNADDRTAAVLVCSKLSAPILAALQCSPRKELWVLVNATSDARRLSSLFVEMPGIAELVSQMAPPPAPSIDLFLGAAVADSRELHRLKELLSRRITTMPVTATAAVDHNYQEEAQLLEQENEQLRKIVASLRTEREAVVTKHADIVSNLEKDIADLRKELLLVNDQNTRNRELLEQQKSELSRASAAPSLVSAVEAPTKNDPAANDTALLLSAAHARNAVLHEDLRVTTQALQHSVRHCDEYKERIEHLERALEEFRQKATQLAEVDSQAAQAQKEQLRSDAEAAQRRENLLLVNEFQQKEKRWQIELLDASDALNRALANYLQARTMVEMQSRTLDAAAASAMATNQLQVEELDHLVAQVRALSPDRRHGRPHRGAGHDGLLLSPTPTDVYAPLTTIPFAENAVGARSSSLQGSVSNAFYTASRALSGRERCLDI